MSDTQSSGKTYDDLYEYIGHMGRFQWIVFSLMFVVTMYSMDGLNIIFVGGEMDHWCRIDELSSLPTHQQKYIAIPTRERNDDVVTDDVIVYSSCEMFDVNWTAYSFDELVNWNRTQWVEDSVGSNSTVAVRRCADWNYDQSIFTSTIISRFDLVCGKEFFVELSTTMAMVGLLIGTVTSGIVSDRFGRKVALLIYSTIKATGNVVSIFASDYVTFSLSKLVAGTGSNGAALIAFVLVMEMVGPKYRTGVGIGFQVSYTIGFMIIPVLAYFIRDDFFLLIATMAPSILLIPCVVLVCESPRWLIVNGRYDEAKALLQRICAINKSTLPDSLDLTQLAEVRETTNRTQGCLSLVRSPTMRLRVLLVDFSWFTAGLVYTAVSMYPSFESSSENLYLSTFLSAVIELPVFVISVFMVDSKFLGRRRTLCISLIGAAVSSFLCALMVMNEFRVSSMIMSLLAKATITLAYMVVYLYGTEIFPTEIRNVGMGTASVSECIGWLLAPSVGGHLKRLWLPLPLIIYGILASVSGLSFLFLPETRGEPLPDTIEQLEKMAATQKNKKSSRKISPETIE